MALQPRPPRCTIRSLYWCSRHKLPTGIPSRLTAEALVPPQVLKGAGGLGRSRLPAMPCLTMVSRSIKKSSKVTQRLAHKVPAKTVRMQKMPGICRSETVTDTICWTDPVHCVVTGGAVAMIGENSIAQSNVTNRFGLIASDCVHGCVPVAGDQIPRLTSGKYEWCDRL